MNQAYDLDAVVRSYAWLGHDKYTELAAIRTVAGRRQVLIDYVTSAAGLAQFVERNAEDSLLLMGLNPRATICTKEDGGLQSARNEDINVVRNLLLDIDLHGETTRERLARLAGFLDETRAYWHKLGINPPVMAYTGRGYHLLFALPPIKVADHAGIASQLCAFRNEFVRHNHAALDRIGAQVDSTQDLRRMVRVYGTTKPGTDRLSTFPNVMRNDDDRLRDYLLQLPAHPPTTTLDVTARADTELPAWFTTLVECDAVIRNLWAGTGKQRGDQSRSGYDYSLTRALVQRGHTNPNDLATILTRRPNGGVARGNGSDYVARTIRNAHGTKE